MVIYYKKYSVFQLENETESFKFKEFMVPKHHVGKIPGVPVGMTFSLRRHVSLKIIILKKIISNK